VSTGAMGSDCSGSSWRSGVGAGEEDSASMTVHNRPESERFWAKVVKGPRPSDCWIWTGAIADDGYGRFWVRRDGRQRALRPQRFAWEQATGNQLQPGVVLLHACDVPICVHATADELSHLGAGTQSQNMIDRSRKGRHGSASSFGWRRTGRQQLVAQSLALRAAVISHGWDEPNRAPTPERS
jgi:hypothetical protein